MSASVLLIDDDVNLLQGLKRQFRKQFPFVTAVGAEEAFEVMASGKEIGVVVSDMRMPGMDGLETLKRIKAKSPDTVRIMLTGNADQETAVNAVNEGEIFRFFSKPCDADILAGGIKQALRHYELICGERELLEQTLAGSVKFMMDVLSFSEPVAFARSTRMREWIKIIGPKMEISPLWRLDFAAMMLPVCNLVLPQGLRKKMKANEALTPEETKTLKSLPETVKSMLSSVPRIGDVADIVAQSHESFSQAAHREVVREVKILRILDGLSHKTTGLMPTVEDFKELLQKNDHYDHIIFNELQDILIETQGVDADNYENVSLPVGAMKAGYTLCEDLKSDEGRLLLSSGTVLSKTHVEKLYSMAQNEKISQSINVLRRKA